MDIILFWLHANVQGDSPLNNVFQRESRHFVIAKLYTILSNVTFKR